MTYTDINQQNIKVLLQNNEVIDERYPVVSYGKDLLQPTEPLPPVSEVIKEYIKEQFSATK